MGQDLQAGIYERVVSDGLRKRLDELEESLSPSLRHLDPNEGASRLARYFRDILRTALTELGAPDERLRIQRQVVNGLLLHLQAELARAGQVGTVDESSLVTDQLLLALLRRDPLLQAIPIQRPSLPLVETHLLINARDEHQVGHELALELASADRVDVLCSFMLWSGYVRFRPALTALASRPGSKIRVLTTVYMGATEKRVLDELHDDATVWEQEPLQNLADRGQLMAFEHGGFWQPMDTLRDKNLLEDLWSAGKAPWKKWD